MQLIDAVPSRCARLLAAGDVAAALVPVIEYQRIDDLSVVPNVCVGSRERVLSVVLASSKNDLKEVRKVALDESSRTSAALVKIIFREFIGSEPHWTGALPELRKMLADNDAALIIGDPGMTIEREGLKVFDMASLWRQHTGLGFVFAMWMIRPDSAEQCCEIEFESARTEGLARAEEIVEAYQGRLGLSRADLLNYLLNNITYCMDKEMQAGLELYYQLAAKHGLIDSVRPLNLFV
jgi:chorismate dehydratase